MSAPAFWQQVLAKVVCIPDVRIARSARAPSGVSSVAGEHQNLAEQAFRYKLVKTLSLTAGVTRQLSMLLGG